MKTILLHPVVAAMCLLALLTPRADAQVPNMLNYQGRVSVNGTNFTGNGNFKFALVSSGRNESRQATGVALRAGKFIYDVEITDGGAGYSAAPAVRLVGGGGSGAEAIATISNGVVTWIEVFNPGNDYTSEPIVEIDPPQENLTYTTYWSHDGTSANGFAPDSSVTLPTEKGLFSALIGGTGMQPVPDSVFTNESVHLRVWFSPGDTNAFEQLAPDQRIATVGYAMRSQNAESALNASNAVAAQSAAIASTVENGAITTDKIAVNAITADKIAAGTVGPTALAAGTVAAWQALDSNPVTASPNTKYLMPEDGSGVLTLPADPPVGTTIEVSGQGTVLANSNQLISGIWTSKTNDFQGVRQLLVSDDGRTIVAYSPDSWPSGGPTPTNIPARMRVWRAGATSPVDYAVPTDEPGNAGPSSQIAMSGDATKFIGHFYNSNSVSQVFKSTNIASGWEVVDLTGDLTNITEFYTVACSSDASVVYLSGRDNNSWSNRIIKSTNFGETWAATTSFPEGYTFEPTMNPFLVSTNGSILLTTADGPEGRRLLRSTNGGEAWSIINPTNGFTNTPTWESRSNGVTMSGDAERIVVTLHAWLPISLATSSDGGMTWAEKTVVESHELTSSAYELTRSGNLLIYAGFTQSIPGMPDWSVSTSSDLGDSWTTMFYSPYNPGYSSAPSASDLLGRQIVAIPNDAASLWNIIRSASDRFVLSGESSRVSLLYRGRGVWGTVDYKDTTGSFSGD